MKPINFKITKAKNQWRAGVISTLHGDIKTPAFVTVGTKATVKALTPAQVKNLGAQTILANTYHLYLQPGDELIKQAGGLHKFMNYDGPMFTDSGGFQVFSLGAAFGEGGVTKFAKEGVTKKDISKKLGVEKLAQIDDDGVTFKSHIDGSRHRLSPEKSMTIQHNLGADIIFAFDECTAPASAYTYQKEALARTHKWTERSLAAHLKNKTASTKQGLFGIVQGGQYEDLRQQSARFLAGLDELAGFGIGGSFSKADLGQVLKTTTEVLPADKPRHLLGIGEPEDIFLGVEAGMDTFDCVTPTRIARNGTLYTKKGKINILNQKYKTDFSPVEKDCQCYTCRHYTAAYLAHLFRAHEMLGATLASIHNLHFIVKLTDNIRLSILDDSFDNFRQEFLNKYQIKSIK
ncbi:MAG: tRNA guanosine(34) transglycosylase Tgt [Candidatus Paceibacterota bacterium]